MDALATIAVEIQATLAGVLVVALVTILEILDLRRAKHTHRQKIQELSESLAGGDIKSSTLAGYESTRYCLISTFSLILQFIFGLIVFAFFSCWALYLINEGFTGSAILSGITALVGIIMPFVVWLGCRRKSKEMAQLIKKIESSPKVQPVTEKEQAIPAAALAEAEMEKAKPEPIAAAKTVAEVQPDIAPSPLKPSAHVPPVAETIAAAVSEKADFSEKIPEDSMLRRHYLTHIQARTQSRLPGRPTDSMLRRHYDSLMASLQGTTSKPAPAPIQPIEPVIITESKAEVGAAAVNRESVKKEGLPQDSMLRRHYLATLRYTLESGLPPRPTDSILVRHFDNWTNHFIETEVNKRLHGQGA